MHLFTSVQASIPSGLLVVKRIISLFFAVSLMGRPAHGEVQSSARDAVISWSRQSARHYVHHYYVIYAPLKSLLPHCILNESDIKRVTGETELNSVTLRDLRPFTSYTAMITTLDQDRSVRRRSVAFETKEAVPDAPPANLRHTVSAHGLDSLSWSEVACDQANGQIRSYLLRLDSSDPWETEVREENVSSTTHVYANLVPFTRYSVQVFAQNGAGRSPYFATLNFTSAPSPPPHPTDLLASELTKDSVQVSWNAPYPPHGVLDHYRLRYWRNEDSSRATEIVVVHEECRRRRLFLARHCYTVKGLDSATVYHFKVRAMNKKTSFSPYSAELTVRTLGSGPPQSLQASDRTESSLKVLWFSPDVMKKGPTAYMVNASLVHSFNDSLEQLWSQKSFVFNTSLDQQFHLWDLFPGSTYFICVQEITDDGVGEASCGNFSTRASVPVVKKAPRVDAVNGNRVNLSLTAVEFQGGPLTAYYLLVVRKVHEVVAPIRLVNFSSAEEIGLGYYVAASFKPGEVSSRVRFVVGSGDAVGGFENPPLEAGAPYSFGWVAESNFSGDTIYGYRLTAPVIVGTSLHRSQYTSPASNTYWPLIAASSVGLLVLVLVATGFTCYCRRKITRSRHPLGLATGIILEEHLTEKLKDSADKSEPEVARPSQRAEMNDYFSAPSNPVGATTSITATTDTVASRPSNPVAIKDLQKYVAKALADGSLLQEYTNLRSRKLHPTSVAEKTENRSKNSHEEVLPYDHSRVILAFNDGTQAGDYINASYIPDSSNPRRYIATQGPTPATFSDFWTMIWQEKVSKIVTLSGLDDQDGATYWPESEQQYGAVAVTLKKTYLKTDFTVRELEIAMGDTTRSVVQFHYTAWPHHGVPPCTDSLQSFITAVRSSHPNDSHPTVVHGRASIGRTGTFILIDSMMSQAETDGEVDCVKQLHSMRHSRVNMVETVEQYIFAHKMLVEMLCTRSRKLTVEQFLHLYQHLKAKHPATGKTPIVKEFEDLCRTRPHPGASDYKGARDERNACKNRTLKILAADNRRPLLSVKSDGRKTDYINAVYVDGFKEENAYLVTQMPLPETVDDFWEMVASTGAITLVTLGPLPDEKTPQFWPELTCSLELGSVTVEHTESATFLAVDVRTFTVSQETKPPRIVKQFHCCKWKRAEKTPWSCGIVLETLRHVEQWQMRAEGAPIVVLCLDGCQESGLFCVLASICHQLKNEHELDVFRCVQRVRTSRPEFIIDCDQYAFCYEAAHAFVESFGAYSNFT